MAGLSVEIEKGRKWVKGGERGSENRKEKTRTQDEIAYHYVTEAIRNYFE